MKTKQESLKLLLKEAKIEARAYKKIFVSTEGDDTPTRKRSRPNSQTNSPREPPRQPCRCKETSCANLRCTCYSAGVLCTDKCRSCTDHCYNHAFVNAEE